MDTYILTTSTRVAADSKMKQKKGLITIDSKDLLTLLHGHMASCNRIIEINESYNRLSIDEF
jgi:hypothetical protein